MLRVVHPKVSLKTTRPRFFVPVGFCPACTEAVFTSMRLVPIHKDLFSLGRGTKENDAPVPKNGCDPEPTAWRGRINPGSSLSAS